MEVLTKEENMAELVQMKMGQGTILVEVAEKSEASKSYDGHYEEGDRGSEEKVFAKIDQALDKVIQNQIVEHCKMLVGAFEQVKTQAIPPKKAQAEFGLQFNGEGNVYVAKVGGAIKLQDFI